MSEETTFNQMKPVDVVVDDKGTRLLLIDCNSGVKMIIKPKRGRKHEFWFDASRIHFIQSWMWAWRKNWNRRHGKKKIQKRMDAIKERS